MNSPMELEIVKGDWGIPSVDVQCLEILAYAKFSAVPLKVQLAGPLLFQPHKVLPTFRHGKQVVLTRTCDIVEYFKKKNFGADFGLTDKERADAEAYKSLLREKLYPALQFVWWINEKNYETVSRPWYGNLARFPLGVYYAYQKREKALQLINSMFPDVELSGVETQLFSDAEKCLTTLNNLLGRRDYFLASGPSSLDACVYAHIATLLKPPFPDKTLQSYIQACPNLTRFVSRISNNYFIDTVKEYNKRKSKEDEKAKQDGENEFPHKRKKQLLAGLFATTAMFAYALSTGIIDISLSQESDDTSSSSFDEFLQQSNEGEEEEEKEHL